MKNRKTYLLRGLLVLLAAALVLLIVGRLLAAPARVEAGQPEERADYESAVVEQVLSDSTEKDPAADNGYRGEQLLLVTVRSGDYQGQQMQVYNYVGPLYGGPLHAGDRATILISSYSDGTVNATVYEFDRLIPLAIVVALVSNLIVTPIYAHMTYQAVAAMILPILLPFNVAKMAIHAVITFLIYKPISNLLNR